MLLRLQFSSIDTLRPRQNGRFFPDDIFECIFLNENVWISLKISLKFVPKVPINNIPVLDLIMTCRRPGDKPLSEPMIVSLPTHICVTRPQWVNDTVTIIRTQLTSRWTYQLTKDTISQIEPSFVSIWIKLSCYKEACLYIVKCPLTR